MTLPCAICYPCASSQLMFPREDDERTEGSHSQPGMMGLSVADSCQFFGKSTKPNVKDEGTARRDHLCAGSPRRIFQGLGLISAANCARFGSRCTWFVMTGSKHVGMWRKTKVCLAQRTSQCRSSSRALKAIAVFLCFEGAERVLQKAQAEPKPAIWQHLVQTGLQTLQTQGILLGSFESHARCPYRTSLSNDGPASRQIVPGHGADLFISHAGLCSSTGDSRLEWGECMDHRSHFAGPLCHVVSCTWSPCWTGRAVGLRPPATLGARAYGGLRTPKSRPGTFVTQLGPAGMVAGMVSGGHSRSQQVTS